MIVGVAAVIVAIPPAILAVRELKSDGSLQREIAGTITTLGQVSRVGITGGLAVDHEGNLYMAANTAILRVSGEGDVEVVAGVPPNGTPPAMAKGPPLEGVRDLALTDYGDIYFSEDSERVRRVDEQGQVSVVAGTGREQHPSPDGVPALDVSLNDPRGLAFDKNGDLLIADMLNDSVRRVDRQQRIWTVGGYIHAPNDMVSAPDGRVYVADYEGRIFEVTDDELVLRVEPPSLDRRSEQPAGGLRSSFLAVAPDGSLLVSDGFAYRVWRVRDKEMEPIAGTGAAVTGGDGGPAIEAQLEGPTAVAISSDWRVFLSTATGLRTFVLT